VHCAIYKKRGGREEVRMASEKRREPLTKTKQHSTSSEAKRVEEFCTALLKDGFFLSLLCTVVPCASLLPLL